MQTLLAMKQQALIVLVFMFLGLQDQSYQVQQAFLDEKEQIRNAKSKFNIITGVLVVWATIVTLVIIIMVVVVFTFMRNRPELAEIPSAESYMSDAETGHHKSHLGDDDDCISQNAASVVNLNFGHGKVASGEGREVEVQEEQDIRPPGVQHEFEVEKISALFEDDEDAEGSSEILPGSLNVQPNFRGAVTSGRPGTGQFRTLFFPDSGSSTF